MLKKKMYLKLSDFRKGTNSNRFGTLLSSLLYLFLLLGYDQKQMT